MVREYSTDELRDKLFAAGKRFYLVDALPTESYVHQHIPGALNLPLAELKERAAQILPEKDVEVVTYCSNPSCAASIDAARWLEQSGYSRVGHYGGGIRDWKAAQLTFDRGRLAPCVTDGAVTS